MGEEAGGDDAVASALELLRRLVAYVRAGGSNQAAADALGVGSSEEVDDAQHLYGQLVQQVGASGLEAEERFLRCVAGRQAEATPREPGQQGRGR